MVKVGRIIYPVLLTAVVIVVALVYPLAVLLLSVGTLAFLVLSRQLNFYKIVMILKRYARNASKLRYELRTRLHLGFGDYGGAALNGEEGLRRSTRGYVK
jgi:hypothetical protein